MHDAPVKFKNGGYTLSNASNVIRHAGEIWKHDNQITYPWRFSIHPVDDRPDRSNEVALSALKFENTTIESPIRDGLVMTIGLTEGMKPCCQLSLA